MTDIITTKPAHLTFNEAEQSIREDLKGSGLKVKGITQGITQPNGETIYFISLEE